MYDGRYSDCHNIYGIEKLDFSKAFNWTEHSGYYGYSNKERNFLIWTEDNKHFYFMSTLTFEDLCIGKVYNLLDDKEKEIFIQEEIDLFFKK